MKINMIYNFFFFFSRISLSYFLFTWSLSFTFNSAPLFFISVSLHLFFLLSHLQLATHVIIGLEEPQRKINKIWISGKLRRQNGRRRCCRVYHHHFVHFSCRESRAQWVASGFEYLDVVAADSGAKVGEISCRLLFSVFLWLVWQHRKGVCGCGKLLKWII